MNSKILLVVLLVLVGGGWYAYSEFGLPKDAAMTDESSREGSAVSFMCADESHFIARFNSSMTNVDIDIDGTVVRTLPLVEGAGQRFESDSHTYVFAGEEATVTVKATGASTTCTQPFDANNAPYNFGDAGEGGGVKQDTALIVSESIVGKWQSTQDAKFVREFKAGGKVADSHDNEVVSEGTFTVFTEAKPLSVLFPLEKGMVYVQLKMSGTEGDTLNFKVTKLTPESLELIYMDRGGALVFTRVDVE